MTDDPGEDDGLAQPRPSWKPPAGGTTRRARNSPPPGPVRGRRRRPRVPGGHPLGYDPLDDLPPAGTACTAKRAGWGEELSAEDEFDREPLAEKGYALDDLSGPLAVVGDRPRPA